MSNNSSLHQPSSFLLSTSKGLERAGYYGTRAVIIFYLTEKFSLDMKDALSLYGSATILVYLTQFFSGLLGDLLNANRIFVFIGLSIQIIGLGLMSVPNVEMVTNGLYIFAIGAGCHQPGMFSELGHLYLGSRKGIMSSQLLYYLFINLGAFFGVLYLGGPKHSYDVTFYIAAGLILGSALFYFITIKAKQNRPDRHFNSPKINYGIFIIGVFIALIFWSLYELNGGHMSIYEYQLSAYYPESYQVPWWLSVITMNSIILAILGLVGFVLFSLKSIRAIQMLAIGCLVTTLAWYCFFHLPEVANTESNHLLLSAVVLLGLAELLITTSVAGMIFVYFKKNRFAMIWGIYALAMALGNKFIGQILWKSEKFEDSNYSYGVSFSVMFGIFLLLLIIYLVFKKQLLVSTGDAEGEDQYDPIEYPEEINSSL